MMKRVDTAGWIRYLTLAALLAGLLLPLMALGTRLDWWHFSLAFRVFRIDFMAAVALAVIALLALILNLRQRHKARSLWAATALVLALAPALSLSYQWYKAKTLPPIHDISTDTSDPPTFLAAPTLRTPHHNSIEYAGAALAAQQRQAYPDLVPLQTDLPPDEVFVTMRQIVVDNGWRLSASDRTQGHIEAVATTLWFGFEDDLVIRIRPREGGSRIDIRSNSRVGRSDLGANAERIRDLIRQFQAATP